MRFSRLSLLWKILIPTSLVMTLSFAITGWLVQRDVVRASYASVEEEAKASFQAYESLWKERANRLGAISEILSTMSDVRAAFGTGDAATIRDTAGELWSRVSKEDAFFLVADGQGRVVASLGQAGSFALNDDLPMVRAARAQFPKQASGFVQKGDELFQVVVTPGLRAVAGGSGAAERPGGRLSCGCGRRPDAERTPPAAASTCSCREIAWSLPPSRPAITAAIAPRLLMNSTEIPDYLAVPTPLRDISGAQVGQLFILRSLAGARQRLAALRREIVALWLLALVAALVITYLVARKIMQPVAELDRAAAEIAKQNYDYQINVRSQDELGRLAVTFQSMCESIRQARQELIRQERISTIGQLSTSIVHDLRNPLAAIYAGAEMMMDSDMPAEMTRRLARNIYRASRGIQDMLQELLDVVRGTSSGSELCSLREVISAAWNTVAPSADARGIAMDLKVEDDLECPMERARMERVFANLFENAIEAMRSGGSISIQGEKDGDNIMVRVEDTGPGISAALQGRLFQPFVTDGQEERARAWPGALSPNVARSRRRHLGRRCPGSRPAGWRQKGGALFWLRLPKNRFPHHARTGCVERSALTFTSNFPVFVGANDEHLHRGAGRRDVLIQIRPGIFRRIQFQTEKRKLRADVLAQRRAIFSNAAGEDNRIHAAQHRQHRADLARQAMRVDVVRQTRPFDRLCPDRFQNLAHVAGEAGNAQQSGLPVQDFIDLIGGIALTPDQIHQNAGIDGARARAHHDAFERRESHAGVHALAVRNRGDGRAVSEMADDQPRRIRGNLQQLGSAPRGVLNADAVESVAPDSLIEPLVRPGINVRGGPERGMKSSVKDRHLRHAGSDDAIDGLNGRQLQRVVRRSEFGLLRDPRANLRSDQNTFAILRPAMHDAMAHHVDLRRGADGFRFALPEPFEHRFQESGGRVGGDGSFDRSAVGSSDLDVGGSRIAAPVGTRAPARRRSLRRALALRDILKPAFETAGAAIEDQDLHAAAIATSSLTYYRASAACSPAASNDGRDNTCRRRSSSRSRADGRSCIPFASFASTRAEPHPSMR